MGVRTTLTGSAHPHLGKRLEVAHGPRHTMREATVNMIFVLKVDGHRRSAGFNGLERVQERRWQKREADLARNSGHVASRKQWNDLE